MPWPGLNAGAHKISTIPSPLHYVCSVPLTGRVIGATMVPIGTCWGDLEQPESSGHHSNSQEHKPKETERNYAWFQISSCSWVYTESRAKCQASPASQRKKSCYDTQARILLHQSPEHLDNRSIYLTSKNSFSDEHVILHYLRQGF